MSFESSTAAQNALMSASLITQAGGAVSSAIGSYSSARTAKANLRAQQAVQDANAKIADINGEFADMNAHADELSAQSALDQGNQNIAALTLKAGQLKGTQRADLAANGVDLNEGSAAEIQASADILKQADMSTLKANAARTAWGYRVEATNATLQGINARAQGAMGKIAADTSGAAAGAISPWSSVGTSLLGSASSVMTDWYRYSKMTS